MTKSDPTSIRFPPEVKAAIEKAAKEDQRSVSVMIERIVRAWLVENGHLPRPGVG
jgi:hypothetical protein